MPVTPFGELRPDVASFDSPYTAIAHNVVPVSDGYAPIKSFVAYTGTLPEQCRGAYYAQSADGTHNYFAGTATHLYRFNNATFVWDDVSSATYNLSAGHLWSFAQFGSNIVAVNFNDKPQTYDVDADSVFTDLGGSPPKARHVSVLKDFLILSGLAINPRSVQWSGLNNITDWATGFGHISDIQTFPDAGEVLGTAGGETAIAFTRDSAWTIAFDPNSQFIFTTAKIEGSRGCVGSYAFCAVGDRIFCLAADGFYMYDRSGQSTPIGAEKINRTFFSEVDILRQGEIVCVADPTSTRVYWLYHSIEMGTDAYDSMLCYDWMLDRWSKMDAGVYALMRGKTLGVTLESLDAIYPNVDAMTVSLDSAQFNGGDFLLTGIDGTGAIVTYTGGNRLAVLETAPAMVTMTNRKMCRKGAVVTDASNWLMQIGSRERLNDDDDWSGVSVPGINGWALFRKTGRTLKARVKFLPGEAWTKAQGVELDVIPVGSR